MTDRQLHDLRTRLAAAGHPDGAAAADALALALQALGELAADEALPRSGPPEGRPGVGAHPLGRRRAHPVHRPRRRPRLGLHLRRRRVIHARPNGSFACP
jgi:hypothetical protein